MALANALLLRPRAALDLAALYAHISAALSAAPATRDNRPSAAAVDHRYLDAPDRDALRARSSAGRPSTLPLILVECDTRDCIDWAPRLMRLQTLLLNQFPGSSPIVLIPVPTWPDSAEDHSGKYADYESKTRTALTANGRHLLASAEDLTTAVIRTASCARTPLGDFETNLLQQTFVSIADISRRCSALADALDLQRAIIDVSGSPSADEQPELSNLVFLDPSALSDLAQFWENDYVLEE
ncbi:uncharacterized protein V1518DRAFT_434004 [Limtongia smithiae]|uniref:uncharacterized protein n=1 Tax=Limtongia smithiae TaxID=1125753 RepID=UPI0034CEF73A